jgi:Glyoxalase/Bleomycin resistance protein/Dioxygenase superfamily
MCVRRRCGGHQDASYGNEGDRNQRVPATPADSRAWARARRMIRSSTAACAHRRFTPQKITFKRTHRTMQLINFTSPNNRLTGRPARVASTALQVRRAHTCSTRLGRVHFKVRDVNRSIPFYTNILGLRLTEHTGRYAFLGTDTEHHSVALEEFDALTIAPSRCAVAGC